MGRDDLNESQDNVVDKHPMDEIHTENKDDKIRKLMLETKEKDDNTKVT